MRFRFIEDRRTDYPVIIMCEVLEVSYIEGFYNRIRRHSAIGYISPIEMELKAA